MLTANLYVALKALQEGARSRGKKAASRLLNAKFHWHSHKEGRRWAVGLELEFGKAPEYLLNAEQALAICRDTGSLGACGSCQEFAPALFAACNGGEPFRGPGATKGE